MLYESLIITKINQHDVLTVNACVTIQTCKTLGSQILLRKTLCCLIDDAVPVITAGHHIRRLAVSYFFLGHTDFFTTLTETKDRVTSFPLQK